MANEFIIRKGYKSLEDSQITGSLSVTGTITGSIFSGSFVGDGSQLSGVSAGFPYTGSATISGSLEVTGSVTATSFIGDGSQLTGIADPTPITATINNTNSPFTVTSQSIVIIDSTNGDVTVNLPNLNTIVGTSDQRPILIYKNDYSQNVVYVQPSGSQLVNGTTQDIIVSIQIGIVYNPTSAGWVTEGTSYQSLAELELFFVPRTETGSLSVATASYVEYANVANKPTLVSGSSQITYSGLTGIPSGIVSGSAQVASFGIFAITGSNQFNGNQSITGSLTVSGQVVAQTLNVQQVTSSIVFSSGSNIFGNSLANTQQLTGSVGVTGSFTVTTSGVELQVTNTGVRLGNALTDIHIVTGSLGVTGSLTVNGTTTINDKLTINRAAEIAVFGTNTASDKYITIKNSSGDLFLGSVSTTEHYLWGNGAIPLTFYTNGTEKMRITSGGNLGLGVTPSAWGSSWKALDISSVSSLASQSTVTRLYHNGYNDNSSNIYKTSAAASMYSQDGGAHQWFNAPSGTAGNAISFTQAMTLDASGNLIVGDTSTSQGARVYISRTSGSSDFATNSTLFLNASSESTTANLIRFNGSIAKGLVFGRGINADNFVWGFTNTTTPVMTLNASGNLLVGTTSDNGARLQVSGGNVTITNSGNVFSTIKTTTNTGVASYLCRNDIDTTTEIGNWGSTRAAFGAIQPNNGYIFSGDELAIGASLALKFGVGGSNTERMRITAGGNVLIGTTTDNGARLQVSGTSTFSSTMTSEGTFFGKLNAVYQNSSSNILNVGTDQSMYGGTNSDGGAFVYGNNKFHISTNSTRRLTVDGSGNVGIGTSSPGARLTIDANSSSSSDATYLALINQSGENVGNIDFNNIFGNLARITGTKEGGGGLANDGIIAFSTAVNSSLTERMRITSGGNVLIGTTTDDGNRLQVNGGINMNGSMTIQSSGVTRGFFGDVDGDNNVQLRSQSALTFKAGGNTERMRITSGGLVGIGTTSASSLLDVRGRQFVGGGTSTYVPTSGTSIIARESLDTFLGIHSAGYGAMVMGWDQSEDRATIAVDSSQDIAFITDMATVDGADNLSGKTPKMIIKGDGKVGIGTTTPEVSFVVKGSSIGSGGKASFYGGGDENNWSANNNEAIRIGRADILNGFYSSIWSASGSGGNENQHWLRFYISNGSGGQTLALTMLGNGNVAVAGALSKGSGSFKIDHPLPSKKDTHHLVHSFIEGPQADNIYRGKIQLVNGRATINLDQAARMTEGTFVLLNGNIQCFTSNESGWTAVKGIVEENILTIEAQDTNCADTVSWLVVGERIDQHMLDTDWTDENGKVITEPLKQ